MAANDEIPRPLVNKLSGLILIIVGFLLATAGYRYGHSWYIGGGIVALVVGLVLVVRKIMERNRSSEFR
ncbi:hypothetical protein SAZ10_17265 [Mesorhizobium sp. BAC0120]|uniref:hypothetical protein n=1 Tax=Mesorhizobium sp. BAC0120 TaxID=3090670 RepID=UPI00298CA817|nr:hypothetical protein [Mesorhizobium sp. BAC0120]MDW6023502.1 hypothetical protein [Mesorhizobium sp. BAC0120]